MARDVERKKKAQSLTTRPYKPRVLKNIRQNVMIPFYDKSERSKSVNSKSNRCYFERIIFNKELEISEVQKIYPSHSIDCIESLEMT